MKTLFVFSNPPGHTPLRLDREDNLIAHLAHRFANTVTVERVHASEVEDIHERIVAGGFNIIHFSGHGSPQGIYLDRHDLAPGGEMVSASRLRSLIALADTPPVLVVISACFSDDSLPALAQVAPYVITAVGPVHDEACVQFARGLYERLFDDYSVEKAYDHGVELLNALGLPSKAFRLHRPYLEVLQTKGSKVLQCTPDLKHNAILVNLDAVADKLGCFGMSEEELCHLLARKLKIHYWIFSVPRERCIIPIGDMLFGEFTWEDANKVVTCTKLMKLQADSIDHWQVWHRLLISYNDLASSEYRNLPNPASPANHHILLRAAKLFQHNVDKYLRPAAQTIDKIGCAKLLPFVKFVINHCDAAQDHLTLDRNPQAIKSLEEALTNFHTLVEKLRPPEEPLG